MASVLSASAVPRRGRRLRLGRGAPVAERPGLPALRRASGSASWRARAPGSASTSATRLPQALPRDRRDHLRGQPHPAAHVAPGHPPAVLQQEGHQHAPAPPHARASGSRPRGSCRTASARRCASGELAPMGGRRDRRGRRDLLRQADETPRTLTASAAVRHQGRQGRPRRQARHRLAGRAWRQRPLLPRRERRQGHRQQHRRRNVAREARLHTDESRIYGDALQARRRARDRQALRRRVRPRRRPHQHRRGLLQRVQARDEGHLPALRARSTCTATSPSSISGTTTGSALGVRRRHARRGGAAGRGRQAVDLPNNSLRRAADGSKAQSCEPSRSRRSGR